MNLFHSGYLNFSVDISVFIFGWLKRKSWHYVVGPKSCGFFIIVLPHGYSLVLCIFSSCWHFIRIFLSNILNPLQTSWPHKLSNFTHFSQPNPSVESQRTIRPIANHISCRSLEKGLSLQPSYQNQKWILKDIWAYEGKKWSMYMFPCNKLG